MRFHTCWWIAYGFGVLGDGSGTRAYRSLPVSKRALVQFGVVERQGIEPCGPGLRGPAGLPSTRPPPCRAGEAVLAPSPAPLPPLLLLQAGSYCRWGVGSAPPHTN